MDTSIRSLLLIAQTHKGSEKNVHLQKAYLQLRSAAENRVTADVPEPFGHDLYVLCAEIAFQYGQAEVSRDCLKMFFMKQQPSNQFLIRAYLCQAQLLAPQSANNPEQLDSAVVFLLKAISLAKKTQRYHFLVYNASVVYWQFCHPFLKPNYRQYLARSLHQVVKALDDIEDTDYEWRAQLMIALIECHLDANNRNDAAHIAAAAATFIKQNVPQLYKQVFRLMVRNQLVESAKLLKDLKSSPELAVFYKLCKLKNSAETDESREFYLDISNSLTQMGVVSKSDSIVGVAQERLSRKDAKNISGRRSPSTQSMSPTGDDDKATGRRNVSSKTGRRTPTPISSKKVNLDSADRPYLLLELAHLCLELGFSDMASDCVENMKTCNVKEQGFYLQLEFLQCLLMVKTLGENQESYQRPVVELRLQTLKRCEEAIMNAIRNGDAYVIQAGCVTQWNLCLPLTQPNLRKHIRKPLTLIADALENIDSLLIQLRCQVHTELAKCEEDLEQIQVAMEHLKKALVLDDGHVYQERLEVMLRRLELRCQLYRQPERAEDQAAMIIEQAGKAASGTIRMRRSLLVKAGEALAPDAFLLVLDSESDTKDQARGPGPLTVLKQLGGKARLFTNSVRKAQGHLRRLGDDNDRERARLWADLAKIARKQEVWDVCRVAARFCLLYDDGRWKNSSAKAETPKAERSRTDIKDEGEEKKSGSRAGSRTLTPTSDDVPLNDKDLIRMLAEVNFIFGEGLVHLLRSEGVQLNDKPIPPEDKSKRPKGYVAKKPEEDPDWIEYCDWIAELSECSTKAFLRGMDLGVELEEAWIVCSAAAYIWNYNNHILSCERHSEIVPTLTSVINGLKKVGHAGETVMLVNICRALAHGLLLPWVPKDEKGEVPPPVEEKGSKATTKAQAAAKAKPAGIVISPDAAFDIKKCIEVCEFAMGVTAGDNPRDVVPVAVRLPLLHTWVMAKQMALQQIPKNMGTDDDSSMEGQKPLTRAIVAIEMVSMTKNGIMEFKEAPSVADAAAMVEKCAWPDHFIELQLWTRLTYLAFETGSQHGLVVKCSDQALRFAQHDTQLRASHKDKHHYMVEREMLSYASVLKGQSLMLNVAGKSSMRHEAMINFVKSCCFAKEAKNYELVMTAARHFWNACLPLVSQPIERQLLKERLTRILDCITATTDKKVKEEPPSTVAAPAAPEGKEEKEKSEANKMAPSKPHQPGGLIGSPEEDLTLRAAMYGVLFQSYADKGEWEQALQAIDQAVTDMPRTKHRLLVFKHRVMVKAKLGQSVNMDIQKFKDESEDQVAQMWRRVALSSKELCEQLSSYQNAIESLTSPSSEFQKVEYLLEFGQWLYTNDFPLQDVLDQVEWAVDILLNFQDQEATLKKDMALKGSSSSVDIKKGQKGGKRVEKKPSKNSARGKGSQAGRSKSPAPEASKTKVHIDSKSEISDQESEINAADYVPVIKETVIGVLPRNPGLTMQDLSDVRQLDALVRSHVLLAELTGRDGKDYADIIVQAYGYLLRLWKVLLVECGSALKELAKQQAVPVEKESKGKSPGGKTAKAGKEKEASPVKEKPKRKGAVDALPELLEDWAVYDAPDEIVEVLTNELMKKTGLNENTMPKPMLTMNYLDSLIKLLRQIGYSHLTLPVLAFEDLLSRTILKNHSLYKLVHAKALEVCLELDFKPGWDFHEAIIGTLHIREEDQSLSRQEIAVLQEKHAQVVREEMKMKESQVIMISQSATRNRSDATLSTKAKALDEAVTVCHIGEVLGAISLRTVWTDTAEVIIRLGYFQRAREFLNEANIAAEAFGDMKLQSRIFLLLGRLSYEEAQYGQAVKFCKKAQEVYDGDEMRWFEIIQLLVDATLHNSGSNKPKHLAKKLLIQALNEFAQVANDRPNRSATIGYIMTMLEAKLAEVQMASVMDQHSDINLPNVMQAILTVCEKVDDAADRLVRLGCCREAVPLVIMHAHHLRDLARAATEVSIHHAYYLEALGVLREAVSLAEEIYFDVQTLTPLTETRSLSLPVQRELCNALLQHGELLGEVLAVQVREGRTVRLQQERKGSVQRLVENYISHTPFLGPTQRDWIARTRTAFEELSALCLSAHSLAGSRSLLRAKALLCLGRGLRLMAESKGPDAPSQWLIQELEALGQHPDAEEREGQDQDKDGDKETGPGAGDIEGADQNARHEEGVTEEDLKLYNKHAALINHKAEEHESSKLYFTYATECLTQVINIAFAHKHTELCSLAALELVNVCGQFDPAASTQFLALYQSCQASIHMNKLLLQAQKDPMTSQLAALLHQRLRLLCDCTTTNLHHSNLFHTTVQRLEKDWQAWRLLEVLPAHLDLLKEFPPNFTFIILQHSPNKDFLYGAVLDKARAGSGEKDKGKGKAAAAASSRAKIFGVETSGRQLQELVEKFRQHKQSMQQLLLKQEYQRTQAALRAKMLENLDDKLKFSKTALESSTAEEEQLLEEEFRELVTAMDNYLKPVLDCVDSALRALQCGTGSMGNMAKEKKDKDSGEALILLADSQLMELPLEALPSLRSDSISSLSRDFSLQLLFHRMHQGMPPGGQEEEPVDKKKGKESNQVVSRIPAARDNKAKQTKLIPLNRQLQAGQVAVDTMNFKYIVDPNLDCAETEERPPIKQFNKMLEEYEQQFTPRWLGVVGEDHTPSVGEWEIYMSESSSFVFYGMERLLSYIPPAKISSLNMPNCMILCILDLAQTSKSFMRQSKVDVFKSRGDLLLESPLSTAVLSSLSGARCLMANQWYCSLADNTDKLLIVMKDLLEKGRSTGQAVRLQYSPRKRQQEEQAAAVEAQEQASAKDAGKGKKDDAASEKGGKKDKSDKGDKASRVDPGSKRNSLVGDVIGADLPQVTDPDKDQEETKEDEFSIIRPGWFNMVCYGMPNLVVTQ